MRDWNTEFTSNFHMEKHVFDELFKRLRDELDYLCLFEADDDVDGDGADFVFFGLDLYFLTAGE